MARGRKPFNNNTTNTWEDIFWKNIPTYINMLNNYLCSNGFELIEVENIIDKNNFKIPKGLNSKEIKQSGVYPVISQSKEFIIGFSDNADLLVKDNFPLIVFGDHSKTIKYVENPFVIGADGVKILKPKREYNEKYFYYFLFGVITDTKDYGRHYSLLRKGNIANVKDIELQKSIVDFLDNLKDNSISKNHVYFNQDIENKISNLQLSQLKQLDVSSELTHQLDLIKQLRQSFLREAMQGKLVKSTNTKETGQQLLANIKAEKAKLIAEKKFKKEKEIAPITEGEIPFEIPEHWAWCRLGEICTKVTDGTHHSPTNIQSGKYKYVTAKNIKDEGIDLSNITFVNEQVHKEIYSRCNPEKGDILYIKDGATTGVVTINNLEEEFSMLSSVALLKLPHLIFNKYLVYSMRSPFYYQATRNEMYGVAITRVTLEKIKNAIIPLPPVHEQEQIVAKLEELMTFCDGLEQSIKESQGYNEMLLQQVLREALQPKEEAVSR